MICGAKIAPRMATTPSTTRANVRTRSATSHASSRPCFWSHSTNTGHEDGRQDAAEHELVHDVRRGVGGGVRVAERATPSAAACAESRRYPVIRDSVVPTDITAVSRTNVPAGRRAGAARVGLYDRRTSEQPPRPERDQHQGGDSRDDQRDAVHRARPDGERGLPDRPARTGRARRPGSCPGPTRARSPRTSRSGSAG